MNAGFSIDVTGLREVEARLTAKIAEMKVGSLAGLAEAATLVLNQATDLAPVISGDLSRSGSAELVNAGEGGATYEIKFDAARGRMSRSKGDFHYAAYAHNEEGDKQSPLYLERPLEANSDKILELIARGAGVGI